MEEKIRGYKLEKGSELVTVTSQSTFPRAVGAASHFTIINEHFTIISLR